jgi:hypothetical protein
MTSRCMAVLGRAAIGGRPELNQVQDAFSYCAQIKAHYIPASTLAGNVAAVQARARAQGQGSTGDSLGDGHEPFALRQAARTGAQGADIQSQGRDCAAERVAVHA